MLKQAGLWVRANLERRRHEREMREEMNEHLDRATRLLMDRGLSADDARRRALREFGDVAYHQTEGREARGTLWLDDLRADIRFATRHFARKPGTTILMFIVLAAGMSISTLLFSWVHGIAVLPPPAVRFESDLVRIRGSSSSGDVGGELFSSGRVVRRFEAEEFQAYRGLTDHFSAVAGWIDRSGVLQVPTDPERRGHPADLTFVTENYFTVLDVHPILGAGLPVDAPDDPTSIAVAVIDHQTWKTHFAERRDVIGSTVTINGRPITIVGVAPERFKGARNNVGVQVWLPLPARHFLLTTPTLDLSAVARLRPGVTPEAATTAVQTVAARVDTTGIAAGVSDPAAEVIPLLAGNVDPDFEGDLRVLALLIGALGTLVLLVTCTNVSALLTGLASARRQEIAIRLSLGAARTRIIRQLLTESAVLAVAAGAAALTLVGFVLKAAVAVLPDLPLELKIEWPTTAFTFAIALAVGVLFGLSPALHATRLALASVLRDSGGGIVSSRARLQRSLVVAQIAFTQPLIVLMATMVVYIAAVMKPMTGSDSGDRVITLRVQTPWSLAFDVTPESERQQRELLQRLRDEVRALPGVENVVTDWPGIYYPGVYSAQTDDLAADRSGPTASVAVRRVEGAHFEVLGVPVIRGRTFGAADITAAATGSEAPVIIGADLASHLFAGADAVGRRLQLSSDAGAGAPQVSRVAGGLRTLVVVGVVDDPVARTRVQAESYRAYLPVDTVLASESLLIRTAGPAAPLLPTIRQLVQSTVPNTIVNAHTLADLEAQHNSRRRRVAGAISAAGIAALVLSAIGLYAVIAFAVAQRTQEIAVRLAVGARSDQIAYGFVGDGLRLGAFGLVLGLPAGLFAVRQLVSNFQMGEVPLLLIIVIASTGIFLVAAASAWAPARRAAAVDPATALRRG